MSSLEKKREGRLRFMVELYEIVDGFDAQAVETAQVATRLGLEISNPDDRLEVKKRVRYLQGEGLINVSEAIRDTESINLTHKGVREVEDAMSKRDEPTEHFPAFSSVYANIVDNSSKQQGGSEDAQALTTITENNRLEVVRIIQSLKTWTSQLALDDDQRSEVEADIQTVETQLGSPRPKVRLIELSLQSVKRTIEEASSTPGTPTSIIASGISSTITDLIKKLP